MKIFTVGDAARAQKRFIPPTLQCHLTVQDRLERTTLSSLASQFCSGLILCTFASFHTIDQILKLDPPFMEEWDALAVSARASWLAQP